MNGWAISGVFFSLGYLITHLVLAFKTHSESAKQTEILEIIGEHLEIYGKHVKATYNSVKPEPLTEASLYTKVKELVWKSTKHVEKTDSLMKESALVASRVESLHSRYNDERTNILYGFEKLIVEIKDYLKAAAKK